MRQVFIIASNTFREVIRDRVLVGILVFAVLLIGLALVLGQLSFSEQARLSANFGFTGIHIGVAVLSIFVGSTLVHKEIEKQTILTLLARPVSRSTFILGKFLGLALINFVVMIGLSIVLFILLKILELKLGLSFAYALFGIFIEGLLLTACSMFFGSFAKPITTVIFSSSIFLLGHWVSSLEFFITKSDSEAFKVWAGLISKAIPDLERFNWRSAPVYMVEVPVEVIGWAAVYGFLWVTALVLLTAAIFRRRDFV